MLPSFLCLPAAALQLLFFFFNDTATTEIYTLSLHDALPIYSGRASAAIHPGQTRAAKCLCRPGCFGECARSFPDRKSTRLNSSHLVISYAVFCLKTKKPDVAQHAPLQLVVPPPLQHQPLRNL